MNWDLATLVAKELDPTTNPSWILLSQEVPNGIWKNVLGPHRISEGFPLVQVEEWYQEILADDFPKTLNMHCFSDNSGTHVDLSSDRQLTQVTQLSWIAFETMSFTLQMDFVERSDANYVNLKCHHEWKVTHVSTLSFSRNGVLQYLSVTAKRKMLPVFRSLNEVILVRAGYGMGDTDFCAKYSSIYLAKFHLLS